MLQQDLEAYLDTPNPLSARTPALRMMQGHPAISIDDRSSKIDHLGRCPDRGLERLPRYGLTDR